MTYHRSLGTNGNGNGDEPIFFELVVQGQTRDPGPNTYETMAGAMDAMIMAHRRLGARAYIVSPPGSENVMVDVDPSGRPRQLFQEDRSAAEAAVRDLDQAAVEVGEQMTREAQRVPRMALAVGGGAVAGALLVKNRMLGALGGAVAGYAIDQFLQRR